MFDEEEIAKKLCNMSPHNLDILSLDYFLDVPYLDQTVVNPTIRLVCLRHILHTIVHGKHMRGINSQ
jgi:hypothetical protein